MNLTKKSHEEVKRLLPTIKYAIDATVGGGRDALFLASLLSAEGKVFCFDVQETAIERSKRLLSENEYSKLAEFFLCGHERMLDVIPEHLHGKINCVFFNLGWLPSSDKKISTKPDTTIKALESAFRLIDKSQSVISILCYKAHDGGMQEFKIVEKFLLETGLELSRYTDVENILSPELFIVKFGV
ncbi:MAG: class I SAM-dependent methyltransferase [Opitutales bacterium]|nr:class I SAM-dependent methyltransferase [Opitutales bacterium]